MMICFARGWQLEIIIHCMCLRRRVDVSLPRESRRDAMQQARSCPLLRPADIRCRLSPYLFTDRKLHP
jgi:hypothetical protein